MVAFGTMDRLNSDRIPWSEMSGCSGFSLDCYVITILPLTFTKIYFQNMTWWIFILCMGYFSYIVGMYIECYHTFRNGCASLDVCFIHNSVIKVIWVSGRVPWVASPHKWLCYVRHAVCAPAEAAPLLWEHCDHKLWEEDKLSHYHQPSISCLNHLQFKHLLYSYDRK